MVFWTGNAEVKGSPSFRGRQSRRRVAVPGSRTVSQQCPAERNVWPEQERPGRSCALPSPRQDAVAPPRSHAHRPPRLQTPPGPSGVLGCPRHPCSYPPATGRPDVRPASRACGARAECAAHSVGSSVTAESVLDFRCASRRVLAPCCLPGILKGGCYRRGSPSAQPASRAFGIHLEARTLSPADDLREAGHVAVLTVL